MKDNIVTDFDEILVILKNGRWQYIQFLSTTLAIFSIPAYVYTGAFVTPVVNHTCILPEDGFNYTIRDECTYSKVGDPDFQADCTQFSYSNETFGPTLTSKFDLVCDHSYLRSFFQTLYMIVGLVSGIINGVISDKLGRRAFSRLAVFIALIFQIIPTFSSNFIWILICRACVGTIPATLFLNSFNWSMEVCEPKRRSIYGVLLSLPWAFGFMWFGVLGYLIRDWAWLQRAGTISCILTLINLWFVPESPRWLIVNGHHDEALQCLRNASKCNNVVLANDITLKKQMISIQHAGENKSGTTDEGMLSKLRAYGQLLWRALKCAELRKRTLLIYGGFTCSFFVYEGLALNAVNFNLDPFLYMITGGAIEIPSYILVAPLVAKYGRTRPSIALFTLCGVSITVLAFISTGPVWLVVILSLLGKFCIASAFQIMFLISSELIPTDVKLVIWSAGYSLSKLGAISSTFLTGMVSAEYNWLPSLIFSGFSYLAAVILFFMPESMNRSIPDTIESLIVSENQNK